MGRPSARLNAGAPLLRWRLKRRRTFGGRSLWSASGGPLPQAATGRPGSQAIRSGARFWAPAGGAPSRGCSQARPGFGEGRGSSPGGWGWLPEAVFSGPGPQKGLIRGRAASGPCRHWPERRAGGQNAKKTCLQRREFGVQFFLRRRGVLEPASASRLPADRRLLARERFREGASRRSGLRQRFVWGYSSVWESA